MKNKIIKERKLREIKFRGRRADNGKWIYGYFVLENNDVNTIITMEGTRHLIISETISQYTGLKDKNDKKGYYKDIWSDGLHKYLVEWIDKKACFVLRRKTKQYVAEYSMAHFPEGEIIGNIYENPISVTMWINIGNIYENPELIKENKQ